MARTGLSKAQVRACRDELLAQGRHPSADAVRTALGTGSKSTIHRYLKELAAEAPDAAMQRQQTAHTLQSLVEELAERLHLDAEHDMHDLRALCANYEAQLQEKERQLAALRGTVAALNARLESLAQGADQDGQAASGHGGFGGLLPNPVLGARGPSPFSIMLSSGRSEVFDIERLGPAGFKFQ
ncbi:DNA-binding protein [Massilia sp. YIM B02443]|uniref:DNA-binding protein n=1 Tax=Massilia sp. YIM B02443 TaxID=3050127 RepID=UPI0025B69589|nr:DNA-binding protein [Massilia sp. YIM B02443]MDN4035452.1 DNA-binding protein [Massilia sp. YIM B02443]